MGPVLIVVVIMAVVFFIRMGIVVVPGMGFDLGRRRGGSGRVFASRESCETGQQ